MKVPCCSVCQSRYDEEERVPLLLQCGHGFCKDCLSKMFSACPDTTLVCPRCRHLSLVGNSVAALRKNFAVLALIHSTASNGVVSTSAADFDCDYTDDDDGDEADEEDENDEALRRRRSQASSSGGCGPVIEVAVHPELRFLRRIGEERGVGVEMWTAVIGGSGGRCRHRVAVKKVAVVAEETSMEWVMGQLENLRRASMWCRNVCTFHGAMKNEGTLCLVMDKCYGSVQSEMEHNEGRLTLEQILRSQ